MQVYLNEAWYYIQDLLGIFEDSIQDSYCETKYSWTELKVIS
jgi:hypothetical protein